MNHKKLKLPITVIVAAIITTIALKLVWAEYIYNDWTCAFAQCRKLK